MRTMYLLYHDHKMYISTNGMALLRFADWIGACEAISQQSTYLFIPNIERV